MKRVHHRYGAVGNQAQAPSPVPLNASPERAVILKSDTPDIQLAIPSINFKSFDGGGGLPAYNFFQELFKNPI